MMTTLLNSSRMDIPSKPTGFAVTNTLLITQLTHGCFTGHALEDLKSKLESLASGDSNIATSRNHRSTTLLRIHQFIPLPSFARVMVVMRQEADAMRIKLLFNRAHWGGQEIRVYFGEHTSLEPKKNTMLGVPDNDRLWLISPPGSPPVDWESTREDPPNLRTHADDLLAALNRVAEQQLQQQAHLELQEQREQDAQTSALPSPLDLPADYPLYPNGPTTYTGQLQTLLPSSKNWDEDRFSTAAPIGACTIVVPELRSAMPVYSAPVKMATSHPSVHDKPSIIINDKPSIITTPTITFAFTTEDSHSADCMPSLSPSSPSPAARTPTIYRTCIPPPL
ncbi:Calcipressin-domain-containing protein [Syncephalis fuscata]|nr:Calcipressin-domain-containing protein [Syncephalis fuscata]